MIIDRYTMKLIDFIIENIEYDYISDLDVDIVIIEHNINKKDTL